VATQTNYPRWRCFRRESRDIALCEKARVRQAGLFPNQFFKEDFSMDGTVDEFLVLAAKQVNRRQKRIFIAAVCEKRSLRKALRRQRTKNGRSIWMGP